MEKAFCGNGFIHLNIAEFHEGIIGGQKKCVLISDQGHEMGELGSIGDFSPNFLKQARRQCYRAAKRHAYSQHDSWTINSLNVHCGLLHRSSSRMCRGS